MSAELVVRSPASARASDTIAATLHRNGPVEVSIQLLNGYTEQVTIVTTLADAYVCTRNNRDVLIPFHAIAVLEVL